jgi:hypothetical protein
MVVNAYNPKYLGGREWEEQGLKPAGKKKLVRPYVNNKIHPDYI